MCTRQLDGSPSQNNVSFEEGPVLVARHRAVSPSSASPISGSVVNVQGREEEDDSLEPVLCADTGSGRAHTPQKLNRTNTPQRPRSSSLLHKAPAPVHTTTLKGGGDARRQPIGRRKQRRWENDNLLGVEKFLRGRYLQEEGVAEHLTVSHSWRSSLSVLMSDQNNSTDAAAVRESVRKGVQPSRSSEREDSSKTGSRRFSGGKWEDAEERFLLVEKRLRDIVVRALRNPTLLSFVVGLENLLEGFAQHQRAAGRMDVPPALSSALAARPTVEAGDGQSVGGTLLVPLGPSPFHRLLLHALCQYRKLRSKSEETSDGRIVRVTIPVSRTSLAAPKSPLTEFVLETRLRGNVASQEAGAARCRQLASTQSSSVPSSAVGVA